MCLSYIRVKTQVCYVIADQYKATKKYLEDNSYNHMNLASKTSDRSSDHRPEIHGEFHLQHINAMHHHLREFLRKYCGVSTKYLANYVALYVWLKNAGANKQRKHIDEISVRRASSPDCYVTRKAIENLPAVPVCA